MDICQESGKCFPVKMDHNQAKFSWVLVVTLNHHWLWQQCVYIVTETDLKSKPKAGGGLASQIDLLYSLFFPLLCPFLNSSKLLNYFSVYTKESQKCKMACPCIIVPNLMRTCFIYYFLWTDSLGIKWGNCCSNWCIGGLIKFIFILRYRWYFTIPF